MADLTTLKVLVVDDDLNIRKIIKSVLTSIGVKQITEATDGQEAYNLLKVPPSAGRGGRKKYDLIICDWMMPVMTGIELLEKIRRDTFLKTTIFLMLTAENEQENIVRAVEDGVNEYIVKPFTAKILEAALRRVAEKIRPG